MSALAAIQASLITIPGVAIQGPLTNTTGGTSVGDSQAGSSGKEELLVANTPVTTGDRVGAGFLTLGILMGVVGGTYILNFME